MQAARGPEQVEPQAALLKGSAAMARVQPLTPLTLHEAVLVGTQARTQLQIDVSPRIGARARHHPTTLLPCPRVGRGGERSATSDWGPSI